jgi:cation diffusion facilitator family transporter
MSSASETMSQAARVPLVGVAVNAALAAVKILAGTFGNSYALIADGIESTSDIVTSLVVWGGLQVAARPADRKHPYGYGKAEALAGAIAAAAILAAAVMIAVQCIREIITPHHLPHWSTLVVLVVVVVTKEILARWVGERGDEFESSALQADAWHHRADALTSLAAFVGISIGLVGGPGYEPADDWAALVACVVIAASGGALLRRSVREMLDRAPPAEFEHRVRAVAGQVPGVLAIEKCKIRKSGLEYFVEIHVEVDGNSTVREGHDIARRVRSALTSSPYRIRDALVHIEPHRELESAPAD